MKGYAPRQNLAPRGKASTLADPSYISKGVVAALAMVSGGTCYWPKPPRCIVPVTVDVDGDMVLNVEIAHIRGARRHGPRYVESMTNEERRQFGNLLLLCPSHHRVIDVIRPDDYSIDELTKWKKNREAGNYRILEHIPVIDEDRLQTVLTDAIKLQAKELEKQVSRFESAIAKLAAIDSESASLITQRMNAAERLHQAASMLIHTEDTSEMLYAAGMSLQRTEITAEALLEAASGLRQIDSAADKLLDAAESFEPIIRAARTLANLVVNLADTHDSLVAIDHILSEKIRELRDLRDDM